MNSYEMFLMGGMSHAKKTFNFGADPDCEPGIFDIIFTSVRWGHL